MKSVLMVDEKRLHFGVVDVARNIAGHYDRKRGFVMVPIMDGALLFAADLLRELWKQTMGEMPVSVFPVTCKSYGSGQQSEQLMIHTDLTPSAFEGRDVLLVDDILDTGQTLTVLRERILGLGATSVYIAVALRKEKKQGIIPMWWAVDIPDVFVYGYGLDLAGQHRGCPEVRQKICQATLTSTALRSRRPGTARGGVLIWSDRWS